MEAFTHRLEQLDHYVIKGVENRRIASHLLKRSQQVRMRNDDSVVRSEVADVQIVIPQGSILGLLRFHILFNDL